jgi:hypothetical protein
MSIKAIPGKPNTSISVCWFQLWLPVMHNLTAHLLYH